MFHFFRFCLGSISRCFHSRRSLLLENLALRQQLAVLTRRHPRPKLSPLDKLFWVLARRFWSAWKQALLVGTPETVVRWHRTGFRLYWSLISKVRRQVGRNPLSKEVRDLIFQMVAENSSWGAPRIHGEILMLGFDVWRGHAVEPKTRKSNAPVPVIAQLAERLRLHRALFGDPENGLMFVSPIGMPINLDALARDVIAPALAKADLRSRGWHAFRRGLASNLNRLAERMSCFSPRLCLENIVTELPNPAIGCAIRAGWTVSLAIAPCLRCRRELHTTMRISTRSFGILESPFRRMTFGLLHSAVSTRFHS
jgi:hypothetical protein